jgi:hypothetical protein
MRFLTNDDMRFTRAEASALKDVLNDHLRTQVGEGLRAQRMAARQRGVRHVRRDSDVRQDFQITPELYWAIAAVWGVERWQDPEFVAWVKRCHAETVVETKIVGAASHAYQPQAPKFHKSYG